LNAAISSEDQTHSESCRFGFVHQLVRLGAQDSDLRLSLPEPPALVALVFVHGAASIRPRR